MLLGDFTGPRVVYTGTQSALIVRGSYRNPQFTDNLQENLVNVANELARRGQNRYFYMLDIYGNMVRTGPADLFVTGHFDELHPDDDEQILVTFTDVFTTQDVLRLVATVRRFSNHLLTQNEINRILSELPNLYRGSNSQVPY